MIMDMKEKHIARIPFDYLSRDANENYRLRDFPSPKPAFEYTQYIYTTQTDLKVTNAIKIKPNDP